MHREREDRQASMLVRGGIPKLDARMANVVQCLSEANIIDGSGVLVGSLAFQTYTGMLGAIFDNATLKTNDVDIVFDPTIEILPQEPFNLRHYLTKYGFPFREIPQLIHSDPASSYIDPHGIRIDLLTPQRGRPKGIITIPKLIDSEVLALSFLDFLIEDIVRALLMGPRGGIPVTVPHPARFAIHKLIVATRRSITDQAKRTKDLHQASQLIALLGEEDSTSLKRAWKEAERRGKKWKQALRSSAVHLDQEILKYLPR